MSQITHRDLRQLSRELETHHYELADGAIYVPKSRLFIQGAYVHDVNGKDLRRDPNLLPTEGLNYVLNASLANQTQEPTFYIAPFKGNVTPQATWTAATFATDSTEASEYDESTRGIWTVVPATAGVLTNTAARAAFTINATISVYGAGLLSASAKSSTLGVLVSAGRFGSPRNLVATDILNAGYEITLTST